MKILVTGNRGYIGTVLTQMLKEKSYDIVGFDVDYYNGCELEPFDQSYPQIIKDIREVSIEDVTGIDAIIPLAALSNELIDFFKQVKFTEKDFLNKKCNRLKQLKYMINNSIIDKKLRRQ